MSRLNEIIIQKTTRCDTRTLPPGTKVTIEDARTDTLYHIIAVAACGKAIRDRMEKQFDSHDHTKVETMEQFTEGLNKGFNSPEFKAWCEMHYNSERHHLKKHVPEDVDLIDVLEMVCDCVCAGMARSGKVFDLDIPSEVLLKAVKNTADALIASIRVID